MFPGDDWMNMMERVTRDQRRIEELTRGALGQTSALDYAQQERQRYEELTRGALGQTSALDYAQQEQQRYEELTRGVLGHSSALDYQQHAAQLEQMMTGLAAGVSDLARALGPIVPAPAYLSWSEHFRIAALPTLSCLVQEWPMPFGLMLEGPAAMQASIAWRVRRDESSIHMAAVTPQAQIGDSPRLSLETEVVCALCGGPILMIGNARLTLIGRRRGVLKRRIFPACATCSQPKNIPALLAALDELTNPAAPRLEIIRGAGRGDGVRKGDLRLVRREPAKQGPNTP